MEATGFSKLFDCITADPLLLSLKEETPGVILSNVDLVTPVYSLVPKIKLEPKPENTLEVVDSEIVNTDINGCECSFCATDEIKTENGFIETILGQGTVSRGLACHRVTNNLIPDFADNGGLLVGKIQSLSRFDTGESEYSDLKLSTYKDFTSGLESCSDIALFKVQEYPTSNVTEVNNGTVEPISNRKLSIAVNIKRELSLKYNPYVKLVDIFAKPVGAGAPSKMIVKNCDESLLPSASEMIISNCDLPLLPDEISLNPSNPGKSEMSPKRKATNGSANSKRVTSRSHDSVKKKCMPNQLKKVVKKQRGTTSKARLNGNEQTSKVLRDSANILNLPASKKRVTGLNSQRKGVVPPSKSPSKNSNILSLLSASPDLPVPSTCKYTAENSLNLAEEFQKIIVSMLRPTEERSLKKPIKKTESKIISVDTNSISDAPVQTEENGKARKNVAANNDTPSLDDEEISASDDFFDESNLLADASVETAESSPALKNMALENNTPSNVSDKKTLSVSNDVPKSTLENKEQLGERNESIGSDVFDKATKNMALINSSEPPTNIGEVASVSVKKRTSVRSKQQLKNAKSSKGAANCDGATENSAVNNTPCSASRKNISLTSGGNPKPILISIKEWKKIPKRFVFERGTCDKKWRKHTIFANQEVTIKTVNMYSSLGKPCKEKLYFIKGKGWVCERCEQIFRKSCHLKVHKKLCRLDVITCSRCPRTYETLGHLRAHLRYCQNPVNKCPECPKIFLNEHKYDQHYSVYHEQQECICGDCTPPRNFRNKNALKHHMYNTHLHPNVTCNACGQVLLLKSIKKHMRSHDRKKIVCLHCGLHFTAERSLRTHWKTHNDTGNPAAIMCRVCGKFFELKTELVKHLKEHESERSFICEHCGKGFFRLDHLDTHLLSHKKKQFICPKCDRGFALRHQLGAHLRTIVCGGGNALTSSEKKKLVMTDKEKPRSVRKQQFTCANCDKAFPSKRQLIIHLSTVLCCKNASPTLKEVDKVGRKKEATAKLSQSPKNQFTCVNCNQNFIRKHLLVAHLSSGLCTERKLTKLNEMENVFDSSKKENEGLRMKSKNPFVYTNCGISFSHKHQLIAHLNVGPCGSDVMSSGKEIIETKSEDQKKLIPKSEEHFITVFENFVHKRQFVNVPGSRDLVSSVEKPIIKKNITKKKTEKSKLVRKNQFSCAKCGQCFIYKRQLTSHLSSALCSSEAMSSAKSMKNEIKTRNKKQKFRSKPTNQFTCGKCGQCFVLKRQFAAHLRSAVCTVNNVISSLDKHKNVVGTKKEEKKSKSAAGVQFFCANCNQSFIHKRKLVAHLGVDSCMSSALTVSEKTKEGDRPEKEEEETSVLTESQHHCEKCNQVFVLEADAHVCSSRNNVSPPSKQIGEAAAENMNEENKLMAVLPEEHFVCGSCDNGFANKQVLNDHLCPAACCSHTLSSSVEAKIAAKEEKKKIEALSVPRRRSVRTRNIVDEQQFPRSCRSAAKSSLKEQTKGVRTKKDERKLLRSMSAKKPFVCGN